MSANSPRDAHARLVQQLCEALSEFVAATASENEGRDRPAAHLSANDNAAWQRTGAQFDDIVSLRDILFEFGLKQPQVAKLRRDWGFPAPIGFTRPIMFRRCEVEKWVRSQPNRDNLAIVLRCRKR